VRNASLWADNWLIQGALDPKPLRHWTPVKLGILYICTGRYHIFWKAFYESAEALLLPGCEKHYFVFTDAAGIEYEERNNVHRIFQEKLEFPLPTLLRFHMFLRAEEQLKEMDYLFFFNANMVVVSEIGPDEILPDPDKEDGLTVALHSGYYRVDSSRFPFERKQRRSLAWMETGPHYFQGCLSGGTRTAYLRMTRQLRDNIQTDLDHNIIAVWWDESHLNKYMTDKHPKILSPAYCHPEGRHFDFAPKILMLDKAKRGGYAFLRGQKEGWLKKIKKFVRAVFPTFGS
jgi:hypothetical protein